MVINYFQNSGKSWRLDKQSDSLEVEIVVEPSSSESDAWGKNDVSDSQRKVSQDDLDYLKHPFLREKIESVSFADLLKCKARTKDHYIGKVEDVYFDDYNWNVKYIKFSGFKDLRDRCVFVPADKVSMIRQFSNTLAIDFDLEDLAWFPNIFVSEEYENFADKLKANAGIRRSGTGSSRSFSGGFLSSLYLNSKVTENVNRWSSFHKAKIADKEEDDSFNVLSCQAIKKYKIYTQDGSVLELKDVVINSNTWEFSCLIFETAHWFSTKRVACPSCFVQDIDDLTREIYLAIPLTAIKSAPSFESKVFNKNYENLLFNHYINFFHDLGEDESLATVEVDDLSSSARSKVF